MSVVIFTIYSFVALVWKYIFLESSKAQNSIPNTRVQYGSTQQQHMDIFGTDLDEGKL